MYMQAGIARALYNLGNIYHAHGKQLSHVSVNREPGKFSPEVSELLQKAVNYYKSVSTGYFIYIFVRVKHSSTLKNTIVNTTNTVLIDKIQYILRYKET